MRFTHSIALHRTNNIVTHSDDDVARGICVPNHGQSLVLRASVCLLISLLICQCTQTDIVCIYL